MFAGGTPSLPHRRACYIVVERRSRTRFAERVAMWSSLTAAPAINTDPARSLSLSLPLCGCETREREYRGREREREGKRCTWGGYVAYRQKFEWGVFDSIGLLVPVCLPVRVGLKLFQGFVCPVGTHTVRWRGYIFTYRVAACAYYRNEICRACGNEVYNPVILHRVLAGWYTSLEVFLSGRTYSRVFFLSPCCCT